MTLSLLAPAKLNLCLKITGRRDDGYHLLQSLFQLLDAGDTLHFAVRNDARIVLHTPFDGVPSEDNLIVRAATALQRASDSKLGVDIHCDKRLPMGGGIGGGSSNAATTLLALNKLWQTGFNDDELSAIGLDLGADVPVFVRGRTAWAEGVGEELTPVEMPEEWFVVIHPGVSVSTREIFSHQELTRNSRPIRIAAFLEQGAGNDCENVVKSLYPEVKNALDWLNQFAPAQLTGTGSCLFARFADEASARDVFSSRPASYSGFVARGVNVSPSHTALNQI
ncbi:4-diphosphocytidyl-2-C-methyl-D-erythritol kinase [Litorivivens lipolytica]|uniref:4-diphosphocytidyl-2-C-methyl-D-erythritol kinase n=1 Tax=Litorivivens lipolytica TaxID=1524264 RepID=A0A7W4W5D6_9GAMM|nr:4-(cytidine 5'-diphospho)-2-C-methyl-D-erythritol kinase [Litorivivens lipolytica]MBB3047142.1 4-diphosphocytidyl-2-C-methyl-D-erythritol kinase [Litorivivens lipolytica]